MGIHKMYERTARGWIKFEKATEYSSLLDIKFKNGILKILPWVISDETESLLRNLIAYKQYNRGIEPFYLTGYATFIDCLINSPTVAEKLRHYGIIDNWLGDDKAVSTMFNKQGNYVTFGNFPPSKIPPNKVDHLLGLLHDTWCSSFAEIVFSPGNIYASQASKWRVIKCATELQEAGIKFEKATESSSLFDIKFKNGIMRIHPLQIDDDIE
ncbi:unnamed protein product [Ilex paraguariensis]|uniref:Uncharacterized protein n=1 Tax=Ilex paraguariensis TaxID=185542 RepID=A0ABC8RR74_9AQUA